MKKYQPGFFDASEKHQPRRFRKPRSPVVWRYEDLPLNGQLKKELKVLLDFTKLGKNISDDTRSINYFLSLLNTRPMTNLTLRKIWLLYKDALALNKVDLSTALILVQAASKDVVEEALASRVYYIKAAHSFALTSGKINKRFYVNLIHSLLNCGPEYLTEAYNQIQDAELTLAQKKQYKAMIDTAVKEYSSEGFRCGVVYSDDNLLSQKQEERNQNWRVDVDEKILRIMADHVLKGIQSHHEIRFTVDEDKRMDAPVVIHEPNPLPVVPESKSLNYVAGILSCANSNNWSSVIDLFEQAELEYQNHPDIYSAMLFAANICERHSYKKILYQSAISGAFANLDIHKQALFVFSKVYGEFDWAWYAYSSIKNLGYLDAENCRLMINVALAHGAINQAMQVYQDLQDNKIELDSEMNAKLGVLLNKNATQTSSLSTDPNHAHAQPLAKCEESETSFSPFSYSLSQSEFSFLRSRNNEPVSSQDSEESFSYFARLF